MFEMIVGHATDCGRERDHNEDHYLVPIGVETSTPYTYPVPGADVVARVGKAWILADGLGGHEGGEVASTTASHAFVSAYYASDAGDTPEDRMQFAIRNADAQVLAKAKENSELAEMGTTLTAVAICEEDLVLGHVGDSRAYLLRDTFEQISEDHTRAADYFRMGRITEKQARNAKDSPLTQAVGLGMDLEIQTLRKPLQANDYILLCSDGLHGMVDDDSIVNIIRETSAPQAVCDTLIQAANDAGGKDNITVILLNIQAQD
jgi:PPM family protein phosphatase